MPSVPTLTERLLNDARKRRARFNVFFDTLSSLDTQVRTLCQKHADALRPSGDKSTTEWADIKAEAKKWNDVSIERRAKATGLESYYDMYRLGSSPEHSDAFSSITYIDPDDSHGLKITNEPSDAHVDLALVAAAASVAVASVLFFEAFGITDDPALTDLRTTVANMIPTDSTTRPPYDR